jgi:hypothetical protein
MGQSRSTVVSSFTIIKGSMIEETYEVMQEWDHAQSVEENLADMKRSNWVGAKSANWLRDVAKVLHRRFDPNGRDRALVALAKTGCTMEVWKPIHLWHMTRDEFLVRDFLTNWLYPRFMDGALRLVAEDVHDYLAGLPRKGLVEEPWGDSTIDRVACGLLRIGADFGLLRGTVARQFQSYNLPERSFLYLLHAMWERQPNAAELVKSTDWRMYMMSPDVVERELLRLHQFRRLHYEVAGSLAQLTLPCATALDFVKEMAG